VAVSILSALVAIDSTRPVCIPILLIGGAHEANEDRGYYRRRPNAAKMVPNLGASPFKKLATTRHYKSYHPPWNKLPAHSTFFRLLLRIHQVLLAILEEA
jgi:hypothetical protein